VLQPIEPLAELVAALDEALSIDPDDAQVRQRVTEHRDAIADVVQRGLQDVQAGEVGQIQRVAIAGVRASSLLPAA
jgi:L-serine deaminase